MLIFQSRQNLFFKDRWHLLKTRHLVKNSSDRQLFLKKGAAQVLLDGRLVPKFHLAPTFFVSVCHPLPSLTVLYGRLQFLTAEACPLTCLGSCISVFNVLALIDRFRTRRGVVNNDEVCETQQPHVGVLVQTEICL
jgi:hypothetical protein